MDDAPLPEGTPPVDVRFLKRLVTVLTATMIAGLLAIVVLIVIRLSATAPQLPDSIALPDSARVVAFTQAAEWYAVVTDDDRILIYDRASGQLRQTVRVER